MDDPSPAPSKSALRAQARGVRAAIDPAARGEAAHRVAEWGLGFLAPAGQDPAVAVAGYHPIGDELDPRPLLARLDAAGAVTALPVVVASEPTLRFRRWRAGEPLMAGPFGVREPGEEAALVEPDIILVPLLAFDPAGHRLGYGAGFYDRALARLRAARPVIAVGLAFDAQEVAAIPHVATDQRLDWVLTPSGPRAFEG